MKLYAPIDRDAIQTPEDHDAFHNWDLAGDEMRLKLFSSERLNWAVKVEAPIAASLPVSQILQAAEQQGLKVAYVSCSG